MSKPSLRPEQLKQLERDGKDFWIGRTRSEVHDRYDQLVSARQFDPAYETIFHEGMHSKFNRGELHFSAGRPKGSISGHDHIQRGLEAAKAYRHRRQEIRVKKRERESADETLRIIAREFTLSKDYLRVVLRRGGRSHI